MAIENDKFFFKFWWDWLEAFNTSYAGSQTLPDFLLIAYCPEPEVQVVANVLTRLEEQLRLFELRRLYTFGGSLKKVRDAKCFYNSSIGFVVALPALASSTSSAMQEDLQQQQV